MQATYGLLRVSGRAVGAGWVARASGLPARARAQGCSRHTWMRAVVVARRHRVSLLARELPDLWSTRFEQESSGVMDSNREPACSIRG